MSRRTDRLGEMFREDISALLQKGLKDPRVGFVTISRVEVTEDLSYAKVLVSVMGDDKEKNSTLIALRNSAGFIRSHVGKNVKIRKMPELQFVLDESLEHAMNIQRILHELKDQGQL